MGKILKDIKDIKDINYIYICIYIYIYVLTSTPETPGVKTIHHQGLPTFS